MEASKKHFGSFHIFAASPSFIHFMAVPYIIVKKHNPNDAKQASKYYARAKSKGSVSLRDLAHDISTYTNLSTPDCIAMIEALLQSIGQHVAEGQTVKLGDFGIFSLSISSEGHTDAKKVSSKSIKGNKLNFRPGKEMRKKLERVSYEKL